MMKRLLTVSIVLLCIAQIAALGQTEVPAAPIFPIDGNVFLKVCPAVAEMTYTSFALNGAPAKPNPEAVEAALCLGYISGLAVGFNTHPELDWNVSGKTSGQVYDAVSDYIRKNPDSRKLPILSLVELTFARPVV